MAGPSMGFEPMDSVVEPRVVADLCIFGLEESYDDTGKQEVSIYVLSQPGFLRQYTNIHNATNYRENHAYQLLPL